MNQQAAPRGRLVAHSGIRYLKKEECMHQHRGRQAVAAFAVASALLIPAFSAGAQTPPADNTKVNKRDRAKDAATADQQKENPTDREITQKIRSALMDDKSLSTYAHNVKVIAQDGRVTLKGPVRTEDEKKTVEAKATEVVGAGRVTNQISIAPAKTSKSK
jgi:hyperosmotically inducible periplasmic protein